MPSLHLKPDLQRDSKKLGQLELLGGQIFDHVEIDTASVKKQGSLNAAIVLCITASGLDRKQVYGALGIDAATFSRIESGQAHFPPNKLSNLMDLCGNEAPLIWLCESRGYDFASMRQHRSDQERRLAELEQENHDLKRLLRLKADVEGTR